MDRSIERSLKKALDLIQKGEHSKARPILTDVLKQDPAQAEAWFLLSYAVPERGRRIYALRQALNANPDFTRAQQRLTKLTGKTRETPTLPQQPGDRPPAPAFAAPADDGVDEWRDEEGFTDEEKSWAGGEDDEGDEAGSSGLARTLLGVLLVVALLVAVYFLAGDALRGIFSGGGAGSRSTATEPAAFRTLPPTWTPAGAITSTPEFTPTATPEITPTPTEEGAEPLGFNLHYFTPDADTITAILALYPQFT